MKKTSEELVIEFHKLNKDKFPDISVEQAKDISYGPWRFLKQQMESGDLTEVRFKYFGTFQVYPGRAKNMLNSLKERFRFNKIAKPEYFRIKDMLEKFINKDEESNS